MYNNNRFENMRDCCLAIGNGIPSKAFKHFIRMGVVEKININQDVQGDTKISKNETKQQAKARA
jgi:hypothetical protein